MSNGKLALVLAAGSILGGCAPTDADAFLVVRNNVAPELEETDVPGEFICTYSSDSGLAFSRGTVAASASSYVMTALIENQVMAVDEQATQRTFFLEGARVDISFTDPDLFTAAELTELEADGVTRYETLFSGAVDPNGGTALVSFELLPSGTLAGLASRVGTTNVEMVVEFQVFGTYAGGESESLPFRYPITVCGNGDAGSCYANQDGGCL